MPRSLAYPEHGCDVEREWQIFRRLAWDASIDRETYRTATPCAPPSRSIHASPTVLSGVATRSYPVTRGWSCQPDWN